MSRFDVKKTQIGNSKACTFCSGCQNEKFVFSNSRRRRACSDNSVYDFVTVDSRSCSFSYGVDKILEGELIRNASLGFCKHITGYGVIGRRMLTV